MSNTVAIVTGAGYSIEVKLHGARRLTLRASDALKAVKGAVVLIAGNSAEIPQLLLPQWMSSMPRSSHPLRPEPACQIPLSTSPTTALNNAEPRGGAGCDLFGAVSRISKSGPGRVG
jgi:hypothetical protein